jgi:hypothetical protein
MDEGFTPDSMGSAKLMACSGLSATRLERSRDAKEFRSEGGPSGMS